MDMQLALDRLTAAGITLTASGDKLDVSYQTEPTKEQWAWLTEHKQELLQLLTAPPPMRTYERAILESWLHHIEEHDQADREFFIAGAEADLTVRAASLELARRHLGL